MRRAVLSLRRPLFRRLVRTHQQYNYTSNAYTRFGVGQSAQATSTSAESSRSAACEAHNAITRNNPTHIRLSASVRRFSTSGADRFASTGGKASLSRGPAFSLRLPMQIRNFSAALAAAAVAGGAYYLQASNKNPLRADSPTSTSGDSNPAVRRGLIVEAGGALYDTTFTGDGPLSKETDDRGRKILEMLSPEQATERLRRNEESWLVGRGKGVTRWDIVQIPSNDPIEDDHAEKLIQVPSSSAATSGAENSDWMFWGVFDGHR
jgi:hypothetical protein